MYLDIDLENKFFSNVSQNTGSRKSKISTSIPKESICTEKEIIK